MATTILQADGPIVVSPVDHDPLVDDADPEEKTFIGLQGQWEKQMKDLSPKKRHLKVEVLLLYWEKVAPSYLDIDEEIKALEDVFKRLYSFKVHKGILNVGGQNSKFKPALLIQKYLANFVCEHDQKETLLIIYYAGHGNPDLSGEMMLRGGNKPVTGKKIKVDEFAWSKAEAIIDTADQADFLLIFDCCFAGKLANRSARKLFSERNFDFLGACGPNELAEVPGKKSFTHAMILALTKLASDVEGFTTTELHNMIMECDTFPKEEQMPCLVSRTNCTQRLLLAPLSKDDIALPTPPASEKSAELVALDYCLRLDFLMSNLPDEEDLGSMCDGLKELITKNLIPAKAVVWNSMHRTRENISEVAKAAALRWRAETLLRRNRRNTSIDNSISPLDGPNRPRPARIRKHEEAFGCTQTDRSEVSSCFPQKRVKS